MNKKTIYIIPVIIAIIAAAIIYFTIKSMYPTVSIVIANQNLKVGTVIGQEHLTYITLPPNAVPPTAYTSSSDVIGKTIINGPIVRGDMIRSEHLSLEGSLMAALKSYAPEGWTAIDIPQGVAVGLKGLRKGDQVNIFGEVPSGQGFIVSEIVKGAIMLYVPDDDNGQYIVAVPNNYAPVIAEAIIRGKPITLALPSTVENIAAEKNVPEATAEEAEEAEENTGEQPPENQ